MHVIFFNRNVIELLPHPLAYKYIHCNYASDLPNFLLDYKFYVKNIVYITLWTFQNRSNYPLKVVLKNHSKSLKNSTVLDSKWVDLHSEHIIWYALVHFFTAMKKSIDLKLQQKKYTKTYHIICSLCRSTHLESNTIGFSILWYFCDLLWFFKTALGGNWTGFGKFRGMI